MRFDEWTTDASKRLLAARVASWDYPRELDSSEILLSWWFTYGPGICWFTTCNEPLDVQFHLAVDPLERGRYPREFLIGIKVIAQLLGFQRIVFIGDQDEPIAGYLLRLRAVPYTRGVYLPLD